MNSCDMDMLGLSSREFLFLRSLGINTLADIFNISGDMLDVIKEYDLDIYSEICNCVHTCGFVLAGEDLSLLNDRVDITNEDISYLSLSGSIEKVLRNNGINTVLDLVILDKKNLCDIEGLDCISVKRIRNAIHSKGCLFIDDDIDIMIIRNKNINKNIRLAISEYDNFTEVAHSSKVLSRSRR